MDAEYYMEQEELALGKGLPAKYRVPLDKYILERWERRSVRLRLVENNTILTTFIDDTPPHDNRYADMKTAMQSLERELQIKKKNPFLSFLSSFFHLFSR